MFAALGVRRKSLHAAESDVDRAVRRHRSRLHDGCAPARDQGLARGNRRGTADQAMTKADQAVDSAADKLDSFVREAQRSSGVKAKVGKALAEDPEFLRKLKPSLIKARAKGETPADPPPRAPSGPQLERPKARKKGGGPSPWLVLGAALAAGYTLAKIIDWRGHAHPRV
jgi:hypothetical protein